MLSIREVDAHLPFIRHLVRIDSPFDKVQCMVDQVFVSRTVKTPFTIDEKAINTAERRQILHHYCAMPRDIQQVQICRFFGREIFPGPELTPIRNDDNFWVLNGTLNGI
jgi:hypothetical protein